VNSKYIKFENSQRVILAPKTFSFESDLSRSFTTLTTILVKSKTKFAFALGLSLEPALYRLDAHVTRLLNGAQQLGILNPQIKEHQAEEIEKILLTELTHLYKSQLLTEKVSDSSFARIKIRLVLSHQGLEINMEPLLLSWQNSKTINVASFQGDRINPEIKTTNVQTSMAARKKLLSSTIDEVILISQTGIIREGSWSNFFWFEKDEKLYTTKSEILPGITRDSILNLKLTTLKDITVDDFFANATEAFITQSSTGVTLINTFDGKTIGSGEHHRSKEVKTLYADYLNKTSKPIFS
jgi:branched-subunit amino acid aminotransferase/4-amino-4-deoxychorismate lyase